MRKRHRPIPITAVQPLRKKQKTSQLIAAYHTLNKRLDRALQTNDHEDATKIREEMAKIGGLERYQQASIRGGSATKGLDGCGRWLYPHLNCEKERLGMKDNSNMLRILDVGAIDGAMLRKHLTKFAVTMIDLNPMGVGVEEQDFFERPLPKQDLDRFHVVCLSLVVNFVGEPSRRAEMLKRVSHFLLPNGLLYLVLPKPCVENSRYMTDEHLVKLMTCLGYDLVEKHLSQKLAFYLLRLQSITFPSNYERFAKKVLLNEGKKRNNFCILL